MRRMLCVAACLFAVPFSVGALAGDLKPEAVTAEGVPAIPAELVQATRPYLEYRTAAFEGWNVKTHGIAITTRFANVGQVHEVAAPLAMRRQITFEPEAIAGASYARNTGDVMVVQKDVGGSEFWQLYRLDHGTLALITDGKSRNEMNAWSHDGKWLAYTSTRRTGSDNDIYVIDPRDPKTDRLVAEVKGGGWALRDFAPDGKTGVVANEISVTKVDLYRLDLATGKMTAIGNPAHDIAYGHVAFAPGGTLWATSDEGSDVQRLGKLDPVSGRFTPVSHEKWDVDGFDISDDGTFIAYIVNEAGIGRLRVMDIASGKVRTVSALPAGVLYDLRIAPWGEIGLAMASARSPSDVFSVDPKTLKLKRWTQSETGGLDVAINREPQLVSIKSFDGEPISGFLYRPDPKKFPGPRPLIFNIHGGPEGQARPVFMGRWNYYLNELGVAVFFPNVRGSTGYGKRFVSLDNGPDLRENSVKDIGAFLDVLAKDPGIDPKRIAETGGSYGGYMCYASAIRYGDRFKAANCIVAISNFVTFLENTQGYRRDLRRVEYGDERDPVQRAKLLAISPSTHAKELKIPLMVQTGANDPRVPPSEAAQMVAAVRANGGEAWQVVAADEGHGFAKKANADYAFLASLMFWKKFLLDEPAAK
jgi:dipeptidyl aminopeptidase/acylaminoacyl peptidase